MISNLVILLVVFSDGAASMAVKGLIVRVTVIRQYPRTTTFEERGEPKQNRAEVLLPIGQTGSGKFTTLRRSLLIRWF